VTVKSNYNLLKLNPLNYIVDPYYFRILLVPWIFASALSTIRQQQCFHSTAALLAMQSAVLATAIPSVRTSVRLSHAGTLSRRIKIGS